MDLDVDIESPQLQVFDAADMYSVNTHSNQLGYDQKTFNLRLIPDDNHTYLELSMSMSELSQSEGDMYARGMYVAMEKQSYSTKTHKIKVLLEKRLR